MQTPKARTSSSGTPPQKTSPRLISAEGCKKKSPQAAAASSEVTQTISTRVVRQIQTSARYAEPTASSSKLATASPKERSPKVADRRSPRSPHSEKKRPSRVAELESQISQLENDLKDVKDQLCSSETSKKQAEIDAEESKQQLLALSVKLEESQKQIQDHPDYEEVHDVKISEAGDQALKSKLEAIKKQRVHDSAALASALDEIKQLKAQLEVVAESEATQIKQSESAESEMQKLKKDLSETRLLVEDMENQLRDCKKSEAQAKELVGETLVQLETAKEMVETLRSDGYKATEAYDAIALELEESRARVNSLEELVNKLKDELSSASNKVTQKVGDGQTELEMIKNGEGESVEKVDNSVKLEAQQLRLALEVAEIRYNEEQARSAEQLKIAFELVEQMKYASGQRQVELEAELRKSQCEIDELKANLMDKETELQGICEENDDLTMQVENMSSGQRVQELEKELQKAKADIENLEASLMDKETVWQNVLQENEKLKLEINEIGIGKMSDEVEAARAAEREALMKVGYMTEEVDKSNRKAARATEQLEAAQGAHANMEAELRRMKVQSDQWRKAAEAAAAMLSAGNNNGQVMERTGSMDSHYSPRSGRISSPYSDNLDDELLKKKNANMLTRLWKKPHK